MLMLIFDRLLLVEFLCDTSIPDQNDLHNLAPHCPSPLSL